MFRHTSAARIKPDELPEKEIRQITEYIFLPDFLLEADATIVLGQTLWQRPFQKALEIHRTGAAGRILFTGGFNAKLGGREALFMQRAWAEMTGNADGVMIDPDASNTMENMRNARSLLEQGGMLRPDMKINIITISYHMRRAIETFKHVFSQDSVNIGVVNYPSQHCHRDHWSSNPTGRTLVLGEVEKIRKYLGKSHTTELRRASPPQCES